ncbi:MAG: hypothetical protein ACRCUE_13420, partial [Bosea sp. (in: a-proteobacteria)]
MSRILIASVFVLFGLGVIWLLLTPRGRETGGDRITEIALSLLAVISLTDEQKSKIQNVASAAAASKCKHYTVDERALAAAKRFSGIDNDSVARAYMMSIVRQEWGRIEGEFGEGRCAKLYLDYRVTGTGYPRILEAR